MKYGISELSIVPLRAEASDKAEMVNQVLFGEHFKVLNFRAKWSKIRLAHDKYEGWICNEQWSEIDKNTYDKLEHNEPILTNELVDIIKNETHQTIPLGCTLPFFKDNAFQINENKYSYKGEITKGKKDISNILENVKLYLNTPYLWGGRTPFGIDCSGFTQMIYRLNGKEIPRDACQQSEIGTTLSFIEESKAGDLAFFDNSEGKIIHVGIILENNFIIHASGKVRIDRLDQQGIFNAKKRKHTHKLRLIKSIF